MGKSITSWPIGIPIFLPKYLGASLVGTVAHYSLLAFLVGFGVFRPVAASVCGAAVGALIIYLLNYHLTFRSTKGHRESLTRFGLVAACGLILNGIILSLALHRLGWALGPSQVLTTGAQFFAVFLVNRRWTF